jgi:hypothetical protein
MIFTEWMRMCIMTCIGGMPFIPIPGLDGLDAILSDYSDLVDSELTGKVIVMLHCVL